MFYHVKIACYHQSAVMFVNNNQSLTKSKHIDINYLVCAIGTGERKEKKHNKGVIWLDTYMHDI